MRFETINAASYLVWRLQHTDRVTDVFDDGDLISLRLRPNQERIYIYLVERPMPLTDIQYHLDTNSKQGIFTLFTYWVDMLLPPDGADYVPDDWMDALLSVQGDKIYGFEVAGRDAFFFPVYFRGQGRQRNVRYGPVVDYASLRTTIVGSEHPQLFGRWWMAGFDDGYDKRSDYLQYDVPLTIAAAYDALGLNPQASVDAVKHAYRHLARQNHPDLNDTDEAHQRMTQVNQAYQQIIRYWEEKS